MFKRTLILLVTVCLAGCTATSRPVANPQPVANPGLSSPAPRSGLPDGFAPASVAFWDENSGLLAGVGGCPTKCTGILAGTADGGKTWTVLHQGGTDIGQSALATHDGGRTWQTITAPCAKAGTTMRPASLSMVATNTGWALCVGDPGTAQQPKVLFRTVDGGITWSQVRDLGSAGYGSTIFFRSSGHGWMTERRGDLQATTDAGRTWYGQDVTSPDRVEAQSVWFVSDQVGFSILNDMAAGAWKLVSTKDSGGTWTTLWQGAKQ